MIRVFALGLALVVGMVGPMGAARADNRSFDPDHLQLALTRSPFFATESAEAPSPWDWRAAVTLRYINSPLVLQPLTGGRVEVIANRTTLDLQGAVELGQYIGLGVALPITVQDNGSIDVSHGAAFGDMRLVPRIEILNRGRFHLAGFLELRIPTGPSGRVLGEGMLVFEPRIAFQVHLGMVELGTNFGIRIREQRSFYDLTVGNETFLTLAMAVTPKPWISAVVEVHGDTAMTSHFSHTQDSPLEILLGLFYTWRGLRAGASGGFGVVEGFGSPRARVMATIEYRKVPKPPVPPPPPKPIPPPPIPPVEPEPEVEETPAEPEPEPEPEVTPEEPDVAVHRGRIELADPVFFAKDRKRVRHRYFPELEQLARVLKRRTELTTIWIEGHADATGPERWNLELSRLRSSAVAQFLVQHGVSMSRLRPVGFGEARPLVPTPRGESNEKNRRVHFFTESSEQTVPLPGEGPVAVPPDEAPKQESP